MKLFGNKMFLETNVFEVNLLTYLKNWCKFLRIDQIMEVFFMVSSMTVENVFNGEIPQNSRIVFKVTLEN